MRRTQQVQLCSMTKPTIRRLHVSGFLSFRELELGLGQVNVLIGSNGSGKSNLLRLFEMLRAVAHGELQSWVDTAGGANAILHYGRKYTDKIKIDLDFVTQDGALGSYGCVLTAVSGDTLKFQTEFFRDPLQQMPTSITTDERLESVFTRLGTVRMSPPLFQMLTTIRTAIQSWHVYHFHDTSQSAPPKQSVYVGNNVLLLGDGKNLAAMLYRMREEHLRHYEEVVERVRAAAPFFGDFVLEPSPADHLLLRWRERGRDTVFSPDALSDGTLRYICLMTLLHQPPEWMPATILIDEPELGLHPYAIKLLAGSLRMAAAHTQILVATQSSLLLDHFAPDEVLVAERWERGATIRRLDAEALRCWLEDYSMGEIWEKNLIGGRPPR